MVRLLYVVDVVDVTENTQNKWRYLTPTILSLYTVFSWPTKDCICTFALTVQAGGRRESRPLRKTILQSRTIKRRRSRQCRSIVLDRPRPEFEVKYPIISNNTSKTGAHLHWSFLLLWLFLFYCLSYCWCLYHCYSMPCVHLWYCLCNILVRFVSLIWSNWRTYWGGMTNQQLSHFLTSSQSSTIRYSNLIIVIKTLYVQTRNILTYSNIQGVPTRSNTHTQTTYTGSIIYLAAYTPRFPKCALEVVQEACYRSLVWLGSSDYRRTHGLLRNGAVSSISVLMDI